MTENPSYPDDYDYADWISNVSGRLLFRLTNPFNYRNDRIVGDVIHYNIKFPVTKKRVLIVSMLIDMRDMRIRTTHKEFTRVFFIAHTHDEEGEGDRFKKKLYGDIYFVNLPLVRGDKYLRMKMMEKREMAFIRKLDKGLKQNIHDFKNITNEEKPIVKEEKLYSRMTNDLKAEIEKFLGEMQNGGSVVYHASVCIKDTGFTFFKIKICPPKEREIKTQQAFYFIKYLFHKHVFHAVSQENITKIQPPRDGFDFAQKLLSRLKHHISEVRNIRSGDPKYLQNLKGVLSYANSLLNSFRRENMIDIDNPIQKRFYELEKSYLENIQASLENALIKSPYKSSSIVDFKNDLVGTALFVFTVTTPYFIINHKNDSVSLGTALQIYGVAFVVALALTLLVSMIIHGRDENYLSKFFKGLISWFFKGVKRHNKRTIAPLNPVANICSAIVSLEMFIRRLKYEGNFYIVISVIVFSMILMGILLFLLLHKAKILGV